MLELFGEWGRVEHELGHSLRDNFLMPVRTVDNPKSFTPIIAKRDGRRWALVQGIEIGNIEALTLPPDLEVNYIRPYFTFDTIETDNSIPQNLTEAVQRIADGEPDVAIDPYLPVGLAHQLSNAFRVTVNGHTDVESVRVREVDRNWVSQRLAVGRRDAAEAVTRLLEKNPARDKLKTFLEPRESRHFAALDHTLSEADLAGVVISSRINVQEIAGIPLASHDRPVAVVYPTGNNVAYVLEPAGRGTGSRYESLGSALAALLPTGRIGVEMEDMGVGVFNLLGLDARDTIPADRLVRRWRDCLALHDLPYYILAARTSAYAIDGALAYAAEQVKAKGAISEKRVDAVYFNRLHKHVEMSGLPVHVTRYMTNNHCGTRTLYPANPTDFSINEEVQTLKIDSGCMIYDEEGYLLAVSDIARTLSFTDEAREIYPLIVDGVRRTLIPTAKAGAVAENVFAAGVDAIWNRRDELSSKRLAPDMSSLSETYKRDVGHLLGKNDLSHLRFTAGDRGVLEEGMVACLEYQWPIDGHAFAYEDTCLITPDGGLNFTSDES